MALSANSPIYRGYLADVDARWNVISSSVDDRTPEERGLKVGHKLLKYICVTNNKSSLLRMTVSSLTNLGMILLILICLMTHHIRLNTMILIWYMIMMYMIH